MEGKEKGIEREAKIQEFMVKKLKRRVLVSKKGGLCTPPPIWRLEESTAEEIDINNNNYCKPTTEFLCFPNPETVSARKLCASLWEIETHKPPLSKMSKASARFCHMRHTNNRFELPHSPHKQVSKCVLISIFFFAHKVFDIWCEREEFLTLMRFCSIMFCNQCKSLNNLIV